MRRIIEFYFKWFDLWIGVYIDTARQVAYIQPLPMLGVKLDYLLLQAYRGKCPDCGRRNFLPGHEDCLPF